MKRMPWIVIAVSLLLVTSARAQEDKASQDADAKSETKAHHPGDKPRGDRGAEAQIDPSAMSDDQREARMAQLRHQYQDLRKRQDELGEKLEITKEAEADGQPVKDDTDEGESKSRGNAAIQGTRSQGEPSEPQSARGPHFGKSPIDAIQEELDFIEIELGRIEKEARLFGLGRPGLMQKD